MYHRKSSLLLILHWIIWLLIIPVRRNAYSYQVENQAPCGVNKLLVDGMCRRACPDGYLDDNDVCVRHTVPQCPENHVLLNGLCYHRNHLTNNLCPSGYYWFNNLCYPIPVTSCSSTTPSPGHPNTSTPIPTTTPEPSTDAPTEQTVTPVVPLPPPDTLTRCPVGSIYVNKKCRKILCPKGEYYQGQCLQPICPEGTVWRGQRCQEPGYIKTILEIENVFTNDINERPGSVFEENINNIPDDVTIPIPDDIIWTTESVTTEVSPPITSTTTTNPPPTTTTKAPPPNTTTNLPPTPAPTTTRRPPITKPTEPSTTTTTTPKSDTGSICCTIVSPRMCKQYGKKWVCFNKRSRLCDANICRHPVIYLKVPKVVYDPPVLIMPPNPPLQACKTPGCDDTNAVDCSGCAHNQRETCSPTCYYYMCPKGGCGYLDLQEYCVRYPGEFGCSKTDGCIWDWCGEDKQCSNNDEQKVPSPGAN